MALENPITSDDLTIDFASLLDLSVSDRVQAAASDTGFAQALINSLTPIQLAKAFPDYYRKELPDISNFILANRYLDDVGRGGFDQQGGGDYGGAKPLYDGEAVPDETVPRIAGQQSEVEKSKVEQILEKAGITGTATGETGVTSAIQDEKGFIISTADTSLSPAQRALLDTIAVGDPTKDKNYWESPDYNTIVNGGKFTDFSDHPRVFGTRTSTAAGRYQFTKSTWDEERAKYNKKFPDNPITDFSPLNQDKLALFLAEQRYRNNTGRDLNADLANPPENMGELIKVGLGKGPVNLTWEIFQEKTAEDAGNAFNANLARNQGYLEQEIEAEAKKKEGVEKQITATPELMKQFESDEKVQKYFAENPEIANKVQEAINSGKITVDDVNSIVNKSNSAQINTSNLENVIEEQQKVAGVRKGPIKTELKRSLSYAADQAGDDQHKVVVVVTSGGQRMEGAEGATGAHRHDDGGAADFNAYLVNRETGERTLLDPRNEEHIPYLTKLTTEFSRVHPDAGVGALYMDDPTKIHFGGDDVSEHGGRARGPLAYSGPDWFKQAHAEGVSQRQEDIKNKINVVADWEKKKQESLTASTTAETPKTPRVFIGDSIAQGLKDAAGGEGNTVVGRKPHEVLADMEQMGAESFKGKRVILSTGLSNNTADLASVRKQMEFLKNAGADVRIAGMSNSREDLAPGNQQLQQLSSEYGYKFMGGFDAGKDKTHPTSYSEYAAAAEPTQTAEAVEYGGHDHDEDHQHIEASAPAPTQTAEAAPTPVGPVGGPEEAPKFRTGGSPDVQDDENLSVFDEDGSLKWKMNSGEGIYVKPKDTEYADDKMDELSGRVDDIDQRTNTPEQNQPKAAPDKATPRPERNWQQNASAVTYSIGSQGRAFKRTKFQNEGFHFSRSSPNSTSS